MFLLMMLHVPNLVNGFFINVKFRLRFDIISALENTLVNREGEYMLSMPMYCVICIYCTNESTEPNELDLLILIHYK